MLPGANGSSRLKPQPGPPAGRARRWLRSTYVVCLLSTPSQVLAVEAVSSSPTQSSPTQSSPANAAGVAPWARAYAQGQWSAAIELLEATPEASRTAWHWLHLARALEKRSRLVEAFGAYERLHDLAADGAALPGMKDVERQAKTESGALSHRIPWAEVSLGSDLPPGALVFVDQQWLDPGRLRSPYPVNPGWHTFLVESNGVVLAARRTFFEEGQSRLVPLTGLGSSGEGAQSSSGALPPRALPPIAVSSSSTSSEGEAPAAAAPARRALTWQPGNPRFDVDRQENLATATYVSLGVGGVGMLVGTGFLIAALNTSDEQSSCYTWGCTSNGDDGGDSFRARVGAATIGYAVGVAGLITSGVLWALHGKNEARSSVTLGKVELEPRLHPTGASLTGRF